MLSIVYIGVSSRPMLTLVLKIAPLKLIQLSKSNVMEIADIPQADLSKKSVFEELFELLEHHRLQFENKFSVRDFYDIVSEFDNAFQEFNSNNTNGEIVTIFNDMLDYTFRNFLTIFKSKGFRDEPIFYAFRRFLSFFSLILKEGNLLRTRRDVIRNFIENFPALKLDISKFEEDAYALYFFTIDEATEEQKTVAQFEDEFSIQIGLYKDDDEEEKTLQVYLNNFVARTVKWNENYHNYQSLTEQYYMIFEICIDTSEKSIEKMLTPLWLIVSALEKIDRVTLELEDIFKGSLKTAIKVWMKDLIAKEETKTVLETAKEIAVKAISGGDVSYMEVKKSIVESQKLTLENQRLQIEIDQGPTEQEIKLERALDIEKKMLENEKLQIENMHAKIEMIEKLSDLAAKGIIEADMIRIDINDVLYILKSKDEIKEIGPDINEIS